MDMRTRGSEATIIAIARSDERVIGSRLANKISCPMSGNKGLDCDYPRTHAALKAALGKEPPCRIGRCPVRLILSYEDDPEAEEVRPDVSSR